LNRISPSFEKLVNLYGSHQRLAVHRQAHRVENKREVLRTAQPAVMADLILKAAQLPGEWIIGCIYDDVGAACKAALAS